MYYYQLFGSYYPVKFKFSTELNPCRDFVIVGDIAVCIYILVLVCQLCTSETELFMLDSELRYHKLKKRNDFRAK